MDDDIKSSESSVLSHDGDCRSIVITGYGVLRDGSKWQPVFGHFDQSVVDDIKTFAQKDASC